MTNNEEIVIRLGVDNSTLSQGLKSADAKVREWSNGITAQLKEVGKALIAPAAAYFTAEGVNRLADYAEQLSSTSQALDVSTDFFQSWIHAVRMSGGTAEQAERALQKLSLAIGQIREKGGTDIEGVSLVNPDNGGERSTEAVLRGISQKFQETTSATERATLAFRLFGKEGKNLVDVLMDSGKGLDDFKNKLSPEEIATLRDFRRNKEEAAGFIEKMAAGVVNFAGNIGTFFGGAHAGPGGEYSYQGGVDALAARQLEQMEAWRKPAMEAAAAAKIQRKLNEEKEKELQNQKEVNESLAKHKQNIDNWVAEGIRKRAEQAAVETYKTGLRKNIADERIHETESFFPGIEELANTMGPNQGAAQRLIGLQQYARGARAFNRPDLAKGAESEYRSLYNRGVDSGVLAPDAAYEARQSRLALEALLKQASSPGFVVQAKTGD